MKPSRRAARDAPTACDPDIAGGVSADQARAACNCSAGARLIQRDNDAPLGAGLVISRLRQSQPEQVNF